ncbi:hypothetical protein KMW28_11855 [Flammeovirga yaeyamensis]|uniref:Uncharacterized protein n=1 Tax=Flammeovirga yaeyamensis TaxID=367791 RepID=A0AAX1MYH2_9BACT|nr:hypothetical protein [Flammeovirga yaeyamensis]MBB3696142.1 hypothetical protein [Flammeovirga yaeyamensis]NMF34826.1 hypothetical protein [Flammeovirga yaeyamensis]QWG00346.1 hypothetical protein KMW28_11855 [Flammeovirga yaeyamensis]
MTNYLQVKLLLILITLNTQEVSIDINDIYLNSINILSLNKETLFKIKGNPDDIEIFFDPIVDDDTTFVYHYKNEYYEFKSGDLTKFSLDCNNVQLQNGVDFCDIFLLKEKYPKFFMEKLKSSEHNYDVYCFVLSNNSKLVDSYIDLYVQNDRVFKIKFWTDL